MASRVTVSSSDAILIAALLIKQFKPSVPTMDSTDCAAASTLLSLVTSEIIKTDGFVNPFDAVR